MGKGRDKRQKAKGSTTAGHGAAKTEKKTQLNEEKKGRCDQDIVQSLEAPDACNGLSVCPQAGMCCHVAQLGAKITCVCAEHASSNTALLFGRDAATGGEDDIDAILAGLDKGKKQSVKGAVITNDAPPPGPRICCVWQPNGDQVRSTQFCGSYIGHTSCCYTHASVCTTSQHAHAVSLGTTDIHTCTASRVTQYIFSQVLCIATRQHLSSLLQRNEEVVMFGGELWDQKADKMYCYDDIYKFNPAKQRWTHIRSAGPHPRSACAGAVHKDCLYIFGGEFTSPNQEKFRHFRCARCVPLPHKSTSDGVAR